MLKSISWLFALALLVCLTGCDDGGESVAEDAAQDDIQAYEDMIAEEEAVTNAEMEGTE